MNLSIGRSTSRSKEVGIRKVIGARRTQLMRQFWGETFVTIFISFLLGVTLAEFFLPVFNSLTNKNLILNYTNDWTTMEGLILLLVITGFVSGSYPALIFSGFKPVDTLKNRIHFGGSNLLTKSLVVIQFSLAVILIIAVVVVSSQLKYIKSKNLGFNREQVLIIPVTEGGIDSWRILEIYKNDFKSHKDILNISGTSNTFALGYHNVGFRNSKGEERRAYEYRIDHNYLATLGITLKEGRNFSKEFLTDSAESVIVNETLVKRFGIGKPVGNILDGFSRSDIQNPRIIGVVKDYNFESLHKEVEPVVLHLNKGSEISYILVRVSENNIPGTIDDINSKWNEIIPDIPFKYSFLDKDIEKQYRIEEQWHSIIIYAGGFAILTAVMGLFGLTALTVTKRTKEIGIRKVLGATISSIVTLISKQIIIQVLIANIIAAPLAYFAATKWLEDFAYKIDLSIIIFITAAFISVFIAFITISFQAIKAGLSNPVKSLRYE
jgi:putative ABC transport system permease protein